MSDLLDENELSNSLKKCPEWDHEENFITRTIEFEEFMEAIDFVSTVGEISDEAQHHPEIRLKGVKVIILLTTEEVGGVSDADIELAQRIDNLVD